VSLSTKLGFSPGKPMPLGASQTETGFNFAIFSRNATRVWLHLFDKPNANVPIQTFELSSDEFRTGDIWHIHLAGIDHGQLYLYQMDGPYLPEEGHRFNRHKPLLDPYAKAIASDFTWDFRQSYGYDTTSPEADLSFSTTTNFAGMPKCIAYGDDGFDWQGDRPLNRPYNKTIIYETHVRSLTCHPTADVEYPGTFRGVIEKIPYFKELGVTAIELLPVHLFNEWEFTRRNPTTGEPLRNYWGYNTLAFFAPQNLYSHYPSGQGQQVVAFKEMVRELHKAGLEVILDVVFNHTVEGNQLGPTLSFKGIDNSIYYLLDDNRRYYKDFSGVGNTFACNHPVVRDFIIDCLRYWVQELHVDGFRFDLATGLSRDRWGQISGNPALPARIAEDPLLRTAKLIAEPWDIGGYQVGSYPGGRWAEWNDKFRDEMRQFWHGGGSISAVATRLAGSGDLYHSNGRAPGDSINFMAAHDGFTLNDVVSYNEKHNEANGEGNRDGHNHNVSYNYGVEGPTQDGGIEVIRSRQIKNFWATLMLSQGTPMVNGGDEFRRTQQGNNNAYCQHNEISWYNWTFLKKHANIFRFAKHVISLRTKHPVFQRTTFFTGRDIDGDQFKDIHWYRPDGQEATWDTDEKCLMCTMDGSKEETGADVDDVDVLLLINADTLPHAFYLPHPPHPGTWRVILDTSLPSPYDIADEEHAREIHRKTTTYRVQPRSTVLMFSWWKRPQ
jgi:glycogen operon protein